MSRDLSSWRHSSRSINDLKCQQDVQEGHRLTRPTPARQDAPFHGEAAASEGSRRTFLGALRPRAMREQRWRAFPTASLGGGHLQPHF